MLGTVCFILLLIIPFIPAVYADYHYEYASSTDISVFNCGLAECISPQSVTTNQEFTFGFYVTNTGPTSTNASVSIPLPNGITMVKAVTDQGSCIFTSSVVSCNMGIMTYPSPAKKILITAKSNQPYSSTSFTATATPSVQDRNTANNSHIIKGPAITGTSSGTSTGTSTSSSTSTCSNCVDGNIQIVPSQTSLKAGDSFQFHLKIGNNGPNTLYFGSVKGNFYNDQGTLPPITVSSLPNECRFTTTPNFSCDYREIYSGQNIQFTLNANVNKDAKTTKFTADATISAGSNKDTNFNNNISSAKGISIQAIDDTTTGGTVADDLAESSGTDRPAIDDTDDDTSDVDTVADDLFVAGTNIPDLYVKVKSPEKVPENEPFFYEVVFGNKSPTAFAEDVFLQFSVNGEKRVVRNNIPDPSKIVPWIDISDDDSGPNPNLSQQNYDSRMNEIFRNYSITERERIEEKSKQNECYEINESYACEFGAIYPEYEGSFYIVSVSKVPNYIQSKISTTTNEIQLSNNKEQLELPVTTKTASGGTSIADDLGAEDRSIPRIADLELRLFCNSIDKEKIELSWDLDSRELVVTKGNAVDPFNPRDYQVECTTLTVSNKGPEKALGVVLNYEFDSDKQTKISFYQTFTPNHESRITCSPDPKGNCYIGTIIPSSFIQFSILNLLPSDYIFGEVVSQNFDPDLSNNKIIRNTDSKSAPIEKHSLKSLDKNPLKVQGEGQFIKRGTPLGIEVKMPDGIVKNFGTVPSSDSFEYSLPITTNSPAGRYEVTVKYGSEIIQKRVIQLVSEKVPTWVKNNAVWWSEGNIDDETFVNGIKHLIENEIILIDFVSKNTGMEHKAGVQEGGTFDLDGEDDDYGRPTDPTTRDSNQGAYHTNILPRPSVPVWIKNTAQWWGQGQISEDEFVTGIEYLIESGILRIK